uniref:Uncharacterized protein n=1 Tax=Oryza barthii TaxID=65489 RepID=A0A0D3G5X7_9ORYZ
MWECSSGVQIVKARFQNLAHSSSGMIRMVEGMELDYIEHNPIPVARAVAGEGDMVDEGKMDKLTKWIQLLVLMNIGQGLLVLFGWDLAPRFSGAFLGDLLLSPATGAGCELEPAYNCFPW